MERFYGLMENSIVISLGNCESFDEVCQKVDELPMVCNWIYTEKSLVELQKQINLVLEDEAASLTV